MTSFPQPAHTIIKEGTFNWFIDNTKFFVTYWSSKTFWLPLISVLWSCIWLKCSHLRLTQIETIAYSHMQIKNSHMYLLRLWQNQTLWGSTLVNPATDWTTAMQQQAHFSAKSFRFKALQWHDIRNTPTGVHKNGAFSWCINNNNNCSLIYQSSKLFDRPSWNNFVHLMQHITAMPSEQRSQYSCIWLNVSNVSMSPWNCSAVLDEQLYAHSRSHWPSTSAFCHSAEVGRIDWTVSVVGAFLWRARRLGIRCQTVFVTQNWVSILSNVIFAKYWWQNVLSALEIFLSMRCINLHFTLLTLLNFQSYYFSHIESLSIWCWKNDSLHRTNS